MAEDSQGYSPSAATYEVEEEKKETQPVKNNFIKDPEEKLKKTKSLPGKKITMEMHDVEVGVLLQTLAKAVDQNIIISESVSGTSYLNIKNASWNHVFLSVLNANSLSYKWEGEIIRIFTAEDVERELKFLDARHQLIAGRQEYELKMESLREKAKMAKPLVSWVYHVKYTDTASLKENLDEFFGNRKLNTDSSSYPGDGDLRGKRDSSLVIRGGIVIDPHTNSLVIRAVKSDLEKMKALVAKLDMPMRQVQIQAHIVEANSDTARELGIQWGGLYSHKGRNWLTSGSNSGEINSTLEEAMDPTSGMAVNFPADLSDGAGLTLGYMAQKIGRYILTVQLSALQEEGKLNILSSPSIITIDNNKAIIESGRDIPYQTVEDDDVEIKWKKAVISLEVTPYIIDDKTLKLEINTTKDELDWSHNVQGNPVILTKKAKTKVVVFDGQTTVIGGLSKDSTGNGESGVPFLKDIPLLGYLFKSKKNVKAKEELLIFITPYILEEKK